MTIAPFIPAKIVAAEPGDADQRDRWVGLPCSGPISSRYAALEPAREAAGFGAHNGVDIAAACAEVIRAVADGIVHFTLGDGVGGTEEGSLGTFCIIKHRDALGGEFFTAYAHLLMQSMVVAGERVQAGQAIGLVGYSGDVIPQGPEGAHLHFAVMEGVGYANRTLDTFYDPELLVLPEITITPPAAPAGPAIGDVPRELTSQELLVMQYSPLGSPDGRLVVAVFPKGTTRTYDDYRHDDGRRSPFLVKAGALVSEYVVMRFEEE